MFFKCSWYILICQCICLFLSYCRSAVQFFFIMFVNFSNVNWFSVKIKVSDWEERNLFSLTVFDRNLLADDEHSSMTMDRHVQAWQWIRSISLLTLGLLCTSACSLETCRGSSIFLLLLINQPINQAISLIVFLY